MTQLENAAGGIKSNMKNVVAWAKKNPAIAAVLIGGVALLAYFTLRNGPTKSLAQRKEEEERSSGLGELGGMGFEKKDYPTPPPLGDFEEPPLFDYFFPPDNSYYEQVERIPAGVLYETQPVDELDIWERLANATFDYSARTEGAAFRQDTRDAMRVPLTDEIIARRSTDKGVQFPTTSVVRKFIPRPTPTPTARQSQVDRWLATAQIKRQSQVDRWLPKPTLKSAVKSQSIVKVKPAPRKFIPRPPLAPAPRKFIPRPSITPTRKPVSLYSGTRR